MKMVTGGLCVLFLALATHGQATKPASSCKSMLSLTLPNTSITLAQVVRAGTFTLPGTGPATPRFSQLPTFCRGAATLTPAPDSDIKIEVGLPIAEWNGKLEAVGNGGWAGTITYEWLAALERWRESEIAPDRLIASRVSDNHVSMTRPICSCPAVAKYSGVGSTNDAANFVCKAP